MKKAFDSVSKPNLQMAWLRQGLQKDIAEWIVNLDTDGITLIRTPTATKAWREHIRNFERPTNREQLPSYFSPERGTAQGAVLSPENWNALFDTLLAALTIAKQECTTLTPTDHELNLDEAFADDLFAGTTSTEFMQLKGEIISAFALIFGLDIATHKLRAFHVNYDDVDGVYLRNQPPIIILIYKPGWIPHEIKLLNPKQLLTHETSMLKYLGIPIDLDNTSHSLMKFLIDITTHTCTLILQARASMRAKVTVLQSHLYGVYNYFLPHLACPLDDIRTKLDPIVSRTLKKITHNPVSYPNALLFIPKEDGGLGFQLPSDLTATLKLRMINRQQMSAHKRRNINTLLTNIYPELQAADAANQIITPQPPPDKPKHYWARPLLDLLNEHNFHLARHTDTSKPTTTPAWVQETINAIQSLNLPNNTTLEAHVDGSWAQEHLTTEQLFLHDTEPTPPTTKASSAIVITPTTSARFLEEWRLSIIFRTWRSTTSIFLIPRSTTSAL